MDQVWDVFLERDLRRSIIDCVPVEQINHWLEDDTMRAFIVVQLLEELFDQDDI